MQARSALEQSVTAPTGSSPGGRGGFWWLAAALAVTVSACSPAPAPPDPRHELASAVLADASLQEVLERAKRLVAEGFEAGDAYQTVWIRDLNTFIELQLQVVDPARIERKLVKFFRYQGWEEERGSIPDRYAEPSNVAVKNGVETDQETSLIQAIYRFVRITGDDGILSRVVRGETVLRRMEIALEFLVEFRHSPGHGLIWGATTADWGDVQPEDARGTWLNRETHRALDIYDNAMFIVALDNYVELAEPRGVDATRWRRIAELARSRAREVLWDESADKYIPHVYLDGSPFPSDFNEREIYYHGGTTVAMEAGLMSREEVARALDRMVRNAEAAGAGSIGLTLYPPYPRGFFLNPQMSEPYQYQNGGDWTWFGARTVRQLVRHGFADKAYRELRPMVARVLENDGFFEWYQLDSRPRGSGSFRGSAGVLGIAIQELQAWARGQQ